MQSILKHILPLVSLLSVSVAWAAPVWLDDDWNIVKTESQASYYLAEPLAERDGVWPVNVYFQGGEILNFEGTLNSADISTGKSVGAYKIYRENGNLLTTGSRNEKGQYEGLTRLYNENGVLIEEADFLAGKRHGINRSFYLDGSVEEEYTNRNGIKEGENIHYFEDGTVSHRFHFVNGKSDGLQLYYYPNGAMSYSVNYKMDKVHGEYASYYKNGQVSHRVNYVDDKTEGLGYSYNENGFLYLETPYQRGKKHGVVRGWHIEGKLRFEESYRDGKQHGAVTHYYESGNLKRTNNLVKGLQRGTQRTYFDQVDAVQEESIINNNGNVKSKTRFNKDGELTYEYVASYPNQREISDEKKYRDGVLISRIQTNAQKKWELEERFDNNGQLTRRSEEVNGKRNKAFIQLDVYTNNIETTHYKHGIRHGKRLVVSPKGEPVESGTYHQGKKSGAWVMHFDGTVRTENYNRKGQLHGELTQVNASGQQTTSEHYLDGKRHGLTENYNNQGMLLAKGNYVAGERDGQWQHQEDYEYDVVLWSGEYQQGNKVGKWFAHSEVGYELGRQQFDIQGRKQGAFYYFGESGNVKRVERYVDDELDGDVDTYGTDGDIYQTQSYDMGKYVRSNDEDDSSSFLFSDDK
ncbi:hypothetical protein LRP50_07800 [Enterovibrio sp. ZSDZ42]|uniref:Antitoxin component YwqK of YwqJK toxin-antitoxin module n=1 Tax=Enterovibrio gelatinilyticus TaxID=2899819 RepID=A0ABT5QYG7_9GAMM|nr:toxin-antitoxin system YwqK family antitoxin [Enterovibrio sp. ZSDZ42]MDD1793029.1 hypothetical protein [Enterovibrio sp. ZSDZ42]